MTKERDRFVDFLRVFAIASVVIGHWFMAVPSYEGGTFSASNALSAVAGLWIITWLFQVMPLFFFVGGFSNAVSIDSNARKGGGYVDFLVTRMRRILRPVMAVLAVWTVVTLIITGAGVSSATIGTLTKWITQPLWFVAVYLAVIALAPVMLRLHRRYGLSMTIAMAAAILAVDALRFGAGLGFIGALNLLLVWSFAQQIGFHYADGSLVRLGRRGFVTLAAAGLGALLVLVLHFEYPGSMVGQDGDKWSNMSPPTAAIAALTVFQIGVAMLLRPGLTRRLENPRLWAAVIAGNVFAMTIYLWHLTALIVTVLVTYPLGIPQFEAGSIEWFVSRPVWFALCAVPLIGLVMIFSKYDDTPATPHLRNDRLGQALAITSLVTASVAILGLALTSLNGIGTFDHGRQLGPVHPTATFCFSLLLLAFVMVERVSTRRVGTYDTCPTPSTTTPSRAAKSPATEASRTSPPKVAKKPTTSSRAV